MCVPGWFREEVFLCWSFLTSSWSQNCVMQVPVIETLAIHDNELLTFGSLHTVPKHIIVFKLELEDQNLLAPGNYADT